MSTLRLQFTHLPPATSPKARKERNELRVMIDALENAEREVATAEQAWRTTADTMEGEFAVLLGLGHRP